jgi:3-isopropylmalate dehydrogenase
MAKYRVAWLPGDGIGLDVLEAAEVLLEKIKLDAEYIYGDIGWEFWCKEGDAFPIRTIELLKNVDAALFGAITSKPAKVAAAELAPELQSKALSYRSPIVRMRQVFDLYVCLRPCKAYLGNRLNFNDQIDLVVFRENTEDLYAGVEFGPIPRALASTLTATAAEILSGSKVAQNTRMLIFPASARIFRQALARGYVGTFMQAGAVVMNSGCGPCLGIHEGALADGETALSTTNRNFKGRMGNPKSEVYLCSPAVAAASAIAGVITDPRNGAH